MASAEGGYGWAWDVAYQDEVDSLEEGLAITAEEATFLRAWDDWPVL